MEPTTQGDDLAAMGQQQTHDATAASLIDGGSNGDDSTVLHTGVVEAIGKESVAPTVSPAIATAVEGEKKRKRAPVDAADPLAILKCKRLHADAVLPERATAGAAGYDMHTVEEAAVPARGQITVSTGLAVAIPQGHYGRVAPRSSLAAKGIDVGAGVVDADYRGQVKIVLFNHGDAPYVVSAGDRVAQLIIERIATPEAQWVDDLDGTGRGDGGFGSTGR